MSLKFRTSVLIGGSWMVCIEAYEAVFERWREANMMFGQRAGDEGIRLAEPMELTVGMTYREGDERRLVKAAFSPTAIGAVVDIPLDLQEEAEADPA